MDRRETSIPTQSLPVRTYVTQEYPLPVILGDATIHTSDQQFLEGLEAGYLSYRVQHRGCLLTERDVYHELMEMMMNPHFTDRWKAGYVLGWGYGLQEPYRPRLPEQRANITQSMLLGVIQGGAPDDPTEIHHQEVTR